MHMEKTNLLFIILAVGLTLTSVLLAYQGKGSSDGALSATGNSEVTVVPDKADIFVSVETLASSAREAKDMNSEKMEAVRKALQRKGVKEAGMETDRFNIYPQYRWDDIGKRQVLEGYRAEHVLRVTTEEIERVGELIDTAVDNGANVVQNVVFGLSKERQQEANGQAMELAAGKAREKADALAKALHVTIVKVSSISESNYNYVPYAYSLAMKAEAMESAPTVISPGEVKVYGQVSVQFEIA